MDAVSTWLDANFISLLNGLAIGLLLFTMAVGLSLIFGLMDVLNLAHGAVFMLGSYMAYQLARRGDLFVAALAVASTIVDVSPFSTNGALVLANAQDVDRDRFYKQILAYSGIVVAVGPLLAWLVFVVPGWL